MDDLTQEVEAITTTDGFRLSANAIAADITALAGQSSPALPESAFIGLSNDGFTAGIQKSFGSSEQSVRQSPADHIGGDHIVTEKSRNLTFGAGVDSDGVYGFAEGRISREKYESYGTGDDAARATMRPSTTQSLSGYATTDGDFGVAVEIGRKDGFLMNRFNNESGIGSTSLSASAGFDSEHGMGVCAEAGVIAPITNSIDGFVEGTACLREDGVGGSVRGGAVFNNAPIPVEVGVMAGQDGRPRAFAGISFRR